MKSVRTNHMECFENKSRLEKEETGPKRKCVEIQDRAC